MRLFPVAAALLCLAQPLSAQDALSPDEEMRCALMALAASGQVEDAQQKSGLAAVATYWMGRYEARSGGTLEAWGTREALQQTIAGAAALAPRCEAAARVIGQRIQAFGRQIAALEEGDAR
ncbi:hypothetical protein EYB45_07765 [Erythrobacteraceae bacterium CFH 75059]|uniref:hypothetical protein n=1 Tax=Qipengyuania thermophila TaxID=2509361 RepID=UPI00102008E1|nr:hypothetical protein [Qipengyuania thermophila]TCD05365.1 hypothetical protein EYB45_07765 [Erythrobacteraceae bacterium CFH 75059]